LNEVRAVAKLCQGTSHINIVNTFRYGKVSMSPYYYLDMELCDFNLGHHIAKWKKTSLTPFAEAAQRVTEIARIMHDVTSGLSFLHEQGEIHRDLKPRNGNSFVDILTVSPLFITFQQLENRRFWFDG
jgi:serine/threonine protein kinase